MWRWGVVLAALVVAGGCATPGADYDVLLVTLDTTRADHLGCYGDADARTPVLDGIAARGVRFADAVTVAPVTLPAHSSIMTGLEPRSHGVHNNGEARLADDRTTLAEVLAARGYDTGAFVSSFVLDARFGLAQGFARYDDHLTVAPGPFPSSEAERGADAVTDAALAWYRTRSPDRPLFWWVHYYDAHAPYQPSPDAGRDGYDGEIAHVDTQVGRLLAALDAAGRRRRTIVVVVGDHGESLGEHGEITHAIFVYDAVARVPFLIEAPGEVTPQVVDDAVVSVVDVVPTVLGLLGITGAPAVDGRDVLSTPRDPARAVWIESLVPYLDYGWAPLYALRRRHDKLIAAPRPEYYDLRADPHELTNRPDDVARAELDTAMATRLARQPDAATIAAGVPRVDADVTARLASLGYLDGGAPGTTVDLPDPKDLVWIVDRLVRTNTALEAGRTVEALRIIADAAVAHPRDRNVLSVLGEVYLRMGRMREAESAYRGVQGIRPSADSALVLAQIEILDGRWDAARTHLDQAAQLDPQHGGVAIARGDLLAATGDVGAADASYALAAQIDPTRATHVAAARRARLPR
ncbi:MAG TPA: sulfatase-like hydrolase/transferase [Candidatus Binatia bacterium]|jgi:arylsulfatase A-like enzyme|nr:sulfatase-like hydrolase/transferase [Candidatus Binatia bacterium]